MNIIYSSNGSPYSSPKMYKSILKYINQLLALYNTYINEKNSDSYNRELQYCQKDCFTCISWVIPTEELLIRINKHIDNREALEVYGGNGLLAYLLRNMGVVITVTDKFDHDGLFGEISMVNKFTCVYQYDAISAIESCDTAEVLLMSWIPKDDTDAPIVILAPNIKTIIYIGEYRGGSCANDIFFDTLEMHYTHENGPEIPNLYKMYGITKCFQRKPI